MLLPVGGVALEAKGFVDVSLERRPLRYGYGPFGEQVGRLRVARPKLRVDLSFERLVSR
jgi:hypothetical protein